MESVTAPGREATGNSAKSLFSRACLYQHNRRRRESSVFAMLKLFELTIQARKQWLLNAVGAREEEAGERGRSRQAVGRSHFSAVRWEKQLHFRGVGCGSELAKRADCWAST